MQLEAIAVPFRGRKLPTNIAKLKFRMRSTLKLPWQASLLAVFFAHSTSPTSSPLSLLSAFRYIAAQSGRTNVVVELLKHGAYTGSQGRHGGTPLIQSAHRGYLEIVLALLRRGCSPNTRNDQGCTALHLAASTNQVVFTFPLDR